MMSFEDFIAGNIDRQRQRQRRTQESELKQGVELPQSVLHAHDRLKNEIFSDAKFAVQAPEFIGVYGKDRVVQDMQEVISLRQKFKKTETPEDKKAKILSEVFEGLVLVNAQQGGWFGDATFFKTSAYDDLKNKTDMYGEWFSPTEGSRVLALAVDLTFSSKGSESKLEQIKKEIDRGQMREIRYFKDARGDYKGTRYNVPRIILGVGTRELADLSRLWMSGKHDKLSNHHARTILITEMHAQLTAMMSHAQKVNKPDIERAYRQALVAVEPLYRDLHKVAELGEYAQDPVLTKIRETMKSF